jgi:hypothetical protein
MRALPLIERALLAILVLAVLLVVLYLVVWHRHAARLRAGIAAAGVPRAGVVLAPADPAMECDEQTWWDMGAGEGFGVSLDDDATERWYFDPGRPAPASLSRYAADEAKFPFFRDMMRRGVHERGYLYRSAEHIAIGARLAADPSAALAELDALAAAPCDGEGAFWSRSQLTEKIRDQAYLATALTRTLPAAARARFIAGEAGYGDAMRHDLLVAEEYTRRVSLPAHYAPYVEPSPIAWERERASASPRTFREKIDDLEYWHSQPDRLAGDLANSADLEDHLIARDWPPWVNDVPGRVFETIESSSTGLWTLAARMNRHRLVVLAVQVLEVADRAGDRALPADASACAAAGIDLGPGPDAAALAYTRIDDHRFTITFDGRAPDNAFTAEIHPRDLGFTPLARDHTDFDEVSIVVVRLEATGAVGAPAP